MNVHVYGKANPQDRPGSKLAATSTENSGSKLEATSTENSGSRYQEWGLEGESMDSKTPILWRGPLLDRDQTSALKAVILKL